MAYITITVAGVDRTAYLCGAPGGQPATFSEQLRERKRFNLEFVSPDGSWFPERGQEILIALSGGNLFRGFLATADRRNAPGTVALFTRCSCVSYEQICNRRRSIARSWTGQIAGGIFNEIIEDSLTGEGITVEFEDGPVIPLYEILEPRPTVTEALDRLCELASGAGDVYYWDITADKVARFFRQNTYPSPFNISDANPYVLGNSGEFASVNETNQGLVNRVFVYLGQFLLDEVTESFVGDGTAKTFELTKPIGSTPTVEVEGVAQTVGVEGVDTGMQWYWSLGSARIRQDDAETELTATDDLDVTYRGLDRVTLGPYDDDPSIDAEAALQDAGTGLYETMLQIEQIGTTTDAETMAAAYLDRYKQATVSFRGATLTEGLRSGQQISINLSSLDINLTMLIESVTMTDIGRGIYLWAFTAIYGPARDDWKRALLGQKPPSTITGAGGGAGTVGPEGPPGEDGGGAEPPANVTLGTLSFRWIHSGVEGASRADVIAEVLIPATPPDPIGTFKGGHIWVELEDQSSNPRFTLGTSALDGGHEANGQWDIRDMGQLPYVAEDQPWKVRLPDISPRRTTVVRVYVVPFSESVDDKPIRAGESGETPNATVTITPYQAGKPSSGTHATTQLVQSVVATAADPVTVSGRLLRPISVTVVLPSDPPDNWAYQLIGYVDGDTSTSPVLSTGVLSRDVETDPVPAGEDGLTTPHTFAQPEPAELQNIVIYAVAGLIMPKPVPRGQVPGPAEFVANLIVPGITASDDVSIGTLTGVLDPTENVRAKLNATMDVLNGLFGVKPLGISTDYVTDAAISTAKILNLAVNTAKMADLSVEAAKLANSSVEASKIANLAVGTAAIAAAAITTAKIANLQITTALIATAAVQAANIGDLQVGTAKIADLAVTDAKIATLSVSKLLAGTISVAVSLTAPTIIVTSGTKTINIDSSNLIKISDSATSVSCELVGSHINFIRSGVTTASLTGGGVTVSNNSGTSSGVLTFSNLTFNGTQVLTARQTGPGNTSDVTDVATRFNNLLTALRTHGLIT